MSIPNEVCQNRSVGQPSPAQWERVARNEPGEGRPYWRQARRSALQPSPPAPLPQAGEGSFRSTLSVAPVALVLALLSVLLAPAVSAGEDPSSLPPAKRDISSVPPDLRTPPMVDGAPAPGRRVRQVLAEYRDTEIHHALYLPENWQPGRRYPVIVEYAGNGPYHNAYGDYSSGKVEGSNLGYGISGGKDFIWLCLPYVNLEEKRNQCQWWGDVEATLDYCRKAVRMVCEEYGGDPSAVILAGFSRGAIACGYLGLHDDATADIWLAFIAYSHYDGVRQWGYSGSDADSAKTRLRRLKGRASFICHEGSVEPTRNFLASTGIEAPFTFQLGPFRNHNDAWVLRDVPERAALRAWLADVLCTKPGTHAVRGRVVDRHGKPLAGVRLEAGATHWTVTGADGRYELLGLIDGPRTVTPSQPGLHFQPAQRDLVLSGSDLDSVDFRE